MWWNRSVQVNSCQTRSCCGFSKMGNWESHEGVYDGIFPIKKLGVDEAYLDLTSYSSETVTVFFLSDDCVKCSPKKLSVLEPLENSTQIVETKYPTDFLLAKSNLTEYPHEQNLQICNITNQLLGEFGVYGLNLDESSNCPEELQILREPVNAYLPLLACFFFYVGLAILWTGGDFLYRKWKRRSEEKIEQSTSNDAPASATKRPRLKSIDTFRGICIVIMIFVNNGGGKYYFFEHATWNGLMVADLVFPWFLWIMGVCIPISIQSQMKRASPLVIFRRILKRSIYLFLIGIILGSGDNIEKLRIFGVLQRFSLTYFVVANIQLLFSTWYTREIKSKKFEFLHDIIRLLPHWIVIIVIVIIHCLVTFLLEVPGCGRGYLGPGGRHDNSLYNNCTGGSTGYVDRQVLSSNHLYSYPTCKETYDTELPYDPEGIMGTLTACLQVFLGVQAGVTLLTFSDAKRRLIRWFSWAVVTGILAAALCKCSRDDGVIPVNKNLWSLSFVFVTSSFALILLGICYVIIDIKKWWSGAPFYYAGMNSIVLYCGHSILGSNFPFTWVIPDMNTHGILMVSSLWTTTLWVLVAIWLFHIKFFLAL